jgi:hypothetical protein
MNSAIYGTYLLTRRRMTNGLVLSASPRLYSCILANCTTLYIRARVSVSPTVLSTTTDDRIPILDGATPYPSCTDPEHRPTSRLRNYNLMNHPQISVHLRSLSPLSYIGPCLVFPTVMWALPSSPEQLAPAGGVLMHPRHHPETPPHVTASLPPPRASSSLFPLLTSFALILVTSSSCLPHCNLIH